MPSDRARDSYDPSRQYRSVVAQQGRVTLEADVNEAQRIAAENLRLETIDLVGPCGTPDDKGYAVSGNEIAQGISIEHGVMYVGGERVELPKQIQYAEQPEWLDRAGDPLWIDPKELEKAARSDKSEFVYLFLREQEVCAVEDVPLREVALGGPDTGQRTRLIQRFVRAVVQANNCQTALRAIEEQWAKLGLGFDPKSMQLRSPARLRVKFLQQPVDESPCDPQVQGGYLGADNQLIRVQITSFDEKTKSGKFAWSYNDASFLYRVKEIDDRTVEFLTAPIDSYQTPRATQAVEILRSAVDLKDDNFIAAPNGFMTTAQAYVPETKHLAVTDAMPAVLRKAAGPLFLRMWEAEVEFTPGQPKELAGTGLQVTIDWNGNPGKLSVGQFWYFAVRPSTPVNVYPQRYLDAPQRPEGPRMWACALATIAWPDGKFSLLEDCRQTFDNLVELTKRHTQCCSIVVTPADVGGGAGLAKLLDSLRGQKATVSLQPGRYVLSEPLTLTKEHNGLTLEGCHDGAVLAAASESKDKFAQGVVTLNAVANCTLRRLGFELPLSSILKTVLSIGVRAIQCADLHIEQCLFSFASAPDASIKAMAVQAIADCRNLRLERNRFLHVAQKSGNAQVDQLMVGLAAMPALPGVKQGDIAISDFVPALLENTVIVGNEFAGLTLAVYVRAEYGRLRCDDNFVRDCDGGFYFANTDLDLMRASMIDAIHGRSSSPANEQAVADLLHAAQTSVVNVMHDLAGNAILPVEAQARGTVKIGQGVDAETAKNMRDIAKQINLQMIASRPVADEKTKPVKSKAAAAAKETVQPQAAAPPTAAQEAKAPAVEISADQVREITGDFQVKFLPQDVTIQPVPALRFSGNDVAIRPNDLRPKEGPLASEMTALWAVVDGKSAASAQVTSNDIRGASVRPIAVIRHQSLIVVTANFVLNSSSERGVPNSLLVQGNIDERNGLMNVSGNALQAAAIISPAPRTAGVIPPPMPDNKTAGDWSIVNSVRQ
jgi:hypothetical protein